LKVESDQEAMNGMGEQWIRECNTFLEQIRESIAMGSPDRLDLVRSMHRALFAINHSILGWLQYVNNPDVMSRFTRDELNEISDALNKFAETFIVHDIEVTKKGMEKAVVDLVDEDEVELGSVSEPEGRIRGPVHEPVECRFSILRCRPIIIVVIR